MDEDEDMEEEYEWEEFADQSIEEIREFIDVENQFITEECDLKDRVYNLQIIIGHIDERVLEDMKEIHKITRKISRLLVVLLRALKQGPLINAKLLREEEEVLVQLKSDVEHRNWRLVVDRITSEKDKEEKVVRLEIQNIKAIHKAIIGLMREMKKSKHVPTTDANLKKHKAKEKFKKQEEYYLLQIYKTLRAYERILRHLWRKERRLQGKLRS